MTKAAEQYVVAKVLAQLAFTTIIGRKSNLELLMAAKLTDLTQFPATEVSIVSVV